MGRPELVSGALRHPNDHRYPRLAAEHVVDVRGVVDDLVVGEQREVDRHQLHDGTQAGHRRPDGDPDDRVLADRRVAHAPLAEALEQPVGDAESTAEDPDVLAEEHHPLVVVHLLDERLSQRVAVAQLAHRSRSPLRTGCSSSSSRGAQAALAARSPWASLLSAEYQPPGASGST